MELLTAIAVVVAYLWLSFLVLLGAALFTLTIALSILSLIIEWQGEKYEPDRLDTLGHHAHSGHRRLTIRRLFSRSDGVFRSGSPKRHV